MSRTTQDVRQAIRRFVQALMFLVPISIVARKSWQMIVFPQDERSWLLILVLVIAAAVPAAIWVREARPMNPAAQSFERIAAAAAAFAGTAVFVMMAAWVGFLFSGPYSGPISAETTFYYLMVAGVSAVGSAFLIASPLLLDAPFYQQTFRARAWKVLGIGLPSLAIGAMFAGPRLGSFFL